MDQRTLTESLFFSGCAFFILMALCSLSHAGGTGRSGGDDSAPNGPVSSSEEPEAGQKNPPEKSSDASTPSEEKKVPEEAQDAFPKELTDPSDATVR